MVALVLLAGGIALLAFLPFIRNRKSDLRIPLCSCSNQKLLPAVLGQKVEYDINGHTVSFSISQCPQCGGVVGHPVDEFSFFVRNLSSIEEIEWLDDFFKQMQRPI